MIQIRQDDLIKALKSFKGLAKQDLLDNHHTPENDFRRAHAEARREIYGRLIEITEQSGIEQACAFAFTQYQNLPEKSAGPDGCGHTQALEMFFNVIGIDPLKLRDSKKEKLPLDALLSRIEFTQSPGEWGSLSMQSS